MYINPRSLHMQQVLLLYIIIIEQHNRSGKKEDRRLDAPVVQCDVFLVVVSTPMRFFTLSVIIFVLRYKDTPGSKVLFEF